MIKKIIFGIFVLLLGFIGFSNAGKVQMIGIDGYPSIYNNQFNLTFLKGGGVLSNYLGQGRSVLALSSDTFFRRANNGLPYFYGPHSQGFFDTYCSCDVISDYDRIPQNANCSCYPMTGNFKGLFTGFFSNVKQYDLAYYETDQVFNNYPGCTEKKYQGKFCRSSSGINATLCLVFNDECIDTCSYSICNGLMGGGLVNSQGLQNLTYGLIADSWIGYAPGQNGYNGNYAGSSEGAVDSNINISITGDYVYSDCTWNDILIALEAEGYNKYVCYGGLNNFELYDPSISYNPIAGTGLSIAQIWANSSARAWDTFPDWFTFWEGLYLDSSDNNYNAMWSSYPAVYHTYFQMYNSYGGGLDPRTLLEYCQLRTLTGDSLNNSAGGYFKPACETIIREKQTGLWDCRVNGTLYSGCEQNPQVAIGTNWNGVGNMSGVAVKSDGINFIQDYFNLIKSKLQTSGFLHNFVGIIPGYIIVFLLGIILFRFISH